MLRSRRAPARFRAERAVRAVLCLGASCLAPALAAQAPARPAVRTAALAPAPYAPPAAGTRYVYDDMVNEVTRSSGWHTYFTDAAGRPGLRVGLFIPDNPKAPLTVDEGALERLWPLRLGAAAKVRTRRGELAWRWELTVVDTQTVQVPAGRFRTYVVQAIEVPEVARTTQLRVNVTMFWYAPAVDAVVRFKSGQLVGPNTTFPIRQELQRIERARRTG